MSALSDTYGGILPKHAIYHSNGFSPYLVLLGVSKFLRAIGLFLTYDLLKVIPAVQFLFITKTGCAVILLVLQKPFSSGKRISKNQWLRIIRHAIFGGLISLLWLFGLTLCGPLRTILLYEHSDVVIVAAACALFTSNGGGPSKFRGAVFFVIAVIVLLLFDHDERMDHLGEHDGNERHHHIFSHLFAHIVNFVGWSDHKGGVVLLALTLCMNVGYNSASKKLSVDLGGSKRLHSLSTFIQAILLLPLTIFTYAFNENFVSSWFYLFIPLLMVILFVFVIDFYIEAVVTNHLQAPKTAVFGAYCIFTTALILGLIWNHPMTASITTMSKLTEIITEDHVISGGVIFSFMTFVLATRILGWPSKNTRGGSFIGYSPSGMPLYSFTEESLHKTHTLLTVLKNGLKQILEDSNSRKIFYFLCINLIFTFVELIYGVWTNSLGLISDGFHMLFDCSALVMGLYAAVMSRWKATRIFSYGFDRVEVLSGFINGLFLVVIGLFVFTEALERLFEPPEVKTERLLTVSVLGLLVNLVGITAFRSSHTHGHGGHGHSHGGHGHSHGGHGHSHGGHGHSHGEHGKSSHSSAEEKHHNVNMEGVFLHVLADTLGSVGVIISSLLIENFSWYIADPLCSLFIATMILLSVVPLLRETASLLMLRTPKDTELHLADLPNKILSIDGVISYREPYVWSHTAEKTFGCIHIQSAPDSSEQKIISQVTNVLKDVGVTSLTVQVEKESYFQHMSGLGARYNEVTRPSHSVQNSLEDSFVQAI